MNLIIPMAGRGKRLRPHTLTTPKPLIPIAGKPIVQRIVEDFERTLSEKIENIGFIVNNLNKKSENQLREMAENTGAKAHIFYQQEPLGTAHALHCAQPLLNQQVCIAFADTLFKTAFALDTTHDANIWVKEIDNPSSFGVVKTNSEGIITDFIEKPQKPISNKAIIGVYFFKYGQNLADQISNLIKNNVKKNGEFQFTDVLENMKNDGTRFTVSVVSEWLDCGNKNITLQSNARYLIFLENQKLIHTNAIHNSEINPQVTIGRGSQISNSKINAGVSIGENCLIENCQLSHSLIQNNCIIQSSTLNNSMIGNFVKINEYKGTVDLGDYSSIGI